MTLERIPRSTIAQMQKLYAERDEIRIAGALTSFFFSLNEHLKNNDGKLSLWWHNGKIGADLGESMPKIEAVALDSANKIIKSAAVSAYGHFLREIDEQAKIFARKHEAALAAIRNTPEETRALRGAHVREHANDEERGTDVQ